MCHSGGHRDGVNSLGMHLKLCLRQDNRFNTSAGKGMEDLCYGRMPRRPLTDELPEKKLRLKKDECLCVGNIYVCVAN